MTVQEIYSAIPANIREWNAFRKPGRVEVEKVVFLGTLATMIGIDADMVHDDGKRFVIYASN